MYLNPTVSYSSASALYNSPLGVQVDQLFQSEQDIYKLLEKLKALNTPENFPLAREGLGRLLSFKNEDIQLKAIQYLKPSLNVLTLNYDVTTNQSHALLALENQIKQAIDEAFLTQASSELIESLLYLYEDLIERLWLLPYLVSDREAYALIVEQNGAVLSNQAQEWLPWIVKQEKQISQMWPSLRRAMERVGIPASKEVLIEINKLKNVSEADNLAFLLAYVSEAVRDFPRACLHYKESLVSLYSQLKNAKTLKLQRACGLIYNRLGVVNHSLCRYEEALKFYKQNVKIFRDLKDKEYEAAALGNVGTTYFSLGEYKQAIEYLKQSLGMDLKIENLQGQLINYVNLGNVYNAKGQHREALEVYKKSLALFEKIQDPESECTIYNNLSTIYSALGDYGSAIKASEKSLQLAQNLKIPRALGATYGNLAAHYMYLGQYNKALGYEGDALKIAQETENLVGEEIALRGFATIYIHQEKYDDALPYLLKSLEIAQKIGDRLGEANTWSTLCNIYRFQNNYVEAVKCQQHNLKIAQETDSLEIKGTALGHLAMIYAKQKDFTTALSHYHEYLEIAEQCRDTKNEAFISSRLAIVYCMLNQSEKCESYFRKSISLYALLQQALEKSEWKITIFEGQAEVYKGLEQFLVFHNRHEEALEISDFGRSRALVETLQLKISSQTHLTSAHEPLKVQEMQNLAYALSTTFIFYSFSSLDETISVWIIPAQGKIICEILSTQELHLEENDQVTLFKSFPFARSRDEPLPSLSFLQEMHELNRGGDFLEKVRQRALLRFKERLKNWHKVFIAPIEKYLVDYPYLTIIPDSFLAQLPFAAFQAEDGTYLIEKYTISITPSLKVLQLLMQLPQASSNASIVIGNPHTGKLEEALLLAEEEAFKVGALLNTPQDCILTQDLPTVERVLQGLPHVRWIHLACHGQAGASDHPHSVFEGRLKLAPDQAHSEGSLYAQQIADLDLQAKLVFLSACYSGTGKLHKEGSIGLVWSFLAAGALSTIATYWPLAESQLTVDMVEKFYQLILSKESSVNKATALRQVMLEAIEIERDNPHLWAAFFLSGLP